MSGHCTPTCDTGSSQCFCKPHGLPCPQGGTCQGTPGSETCQGGLCAFSNILPNPSNAKKWKISGTDSGAPRSLSMCVPAGWGGRFWARTQCTEGADTLNCLTGQCGEPGAYDCSTSPSGVTLFEPTLDAPAGVGTFDYYDVGLVSGYNLAMKVETSSPGCPVPQCTSDLKRACPNPLRVKAGACSNDTDCPDAGVCLAGECVIGCLDPCDACKKVPPPRALRCDKFQDQYCCTGNNTESCNLGSATCFDDQDCRNLSSGQINATCDRDTHLCKLPCTTDSDCPGGTCQTAIGQCAPPLVMCAPPTMSCPAASSCDSSIIPGGDVCVSGGDCCGPYNRRWLRAARKADRGRRPYTKIFKKACPSAYSFQYDDPSSLFTCSDPGAGEIDYKVTFCPRVRGGS